MSSKTSVRKSEDSDDDEQCSDPECTGCQEVVNNPPPGHDYEKKAIQKEPKQFSEKLRQSLVFVKKRLSTRNSKVHFAIPAKPVSMAQTPKHPHKAKQLFNLAIRLSHLMLGVVNLVSISIHAGQAILSQGSIVYFNIVCAIFAELILVGFEALNVPRRNSTPRDWIYSLMFLNIFWCIMYLISASITTYYFRQTYYYYYGTSSVEYIPKGLFVATIFMWGTCLIYIFSSMYYGVRYFQLKSADRREKELKNKDESKTNIISDH